MDEFITYLEGHIDQIEAICDRIEKRIEYLGDLRIILPQINQTVTVILSLLGENPEVLRLNQEFVIQVLKDLVYGIEQEDNVYLLDVLRYGLLSIYRYVLDVVQKGEADEQGCV